MEFPQLNPKHLPLGTRVGPWRLEYMLGRGNFGAVYLAEGVAPESSGRAALKVALSPGDARFAREAELLSRLHHPCVPRFLGHGHWLSPVGLLHPYVAMEWIDGLPLYDWAREASPSSRQVLRLLAGLARALEAIHAAGGVHRDFKGSNILVLPQDGRGVLVDFGACHYLGASTLTWQPFPPGTPAYRSPEACRYSLHLLDASGPLTPYAPAPADDVFALGITAWRLVTGHYPPSPEPQDPQAHIWDLEKGSGPRPAHEFNPRCSPELSALINRMLAVRAEARGGAGELAEALEAAARRVGLGADAPLFLQQAPRLGPGVDMPVPAARRHRRRGLSWMTAAGLASALGLAAVYALNLRAGDEAERTQRAGDTEEPDTGPVGVGDAVLTAPVATPRAPSTWSGIGVDLPAKPFPGQTRPDANGRCPDTTQVAINGGCWWKLEGSPKDCRGQSYVYRGKCYGPAFPPPLPPTSSPADAPDGGAR